MAGRLPRPQPTSKWRPSCCNRSRRRGLARRVTESLYAWAWGKGARFAYLQVVATNAAALPLYDAQGFRTTYAYEYIVPPPS